MRLSRVSTPVGGGIAFSKACGEGREPHTGVAGKREDATAKYYLNGVVEYVCRGLTVVADRSVPAKVDKLNWYVESGGSWRGLGLRRTASDGQRKQRRGETGLWWHAHGGRVVA